MGTKAQSESLLTITRFRFNILFMRVGGIPIFMQMSIGYFMFVMVWYFCTFVTLAGVWLDAFLGHHDLKDILASLRMAIAFTVTVWVHFCLRLNVKSIEQLFRCTEVFSWEEMPSKDPSTGQLTSLGYWQWFQKGLKYMVIVNWFMHLVPCCHRIFIEHRMMLPVWLPIDLKASPAFELTNLCQFLGTVQAGASFYSLLGLYSTTMFIVYCQVDKLKMSFKNVKSEPSELNQNEIELNKCIIHHQQILEYLPKMESTLNICIGGVLFLEMACCCTCAFSAVISWGDISDMAQAMLIYFIYMTSICCVCWAGEQLSNRVESVRDVVYEGHWIEAPISFQKSIMLIITRTNARFNLTAGKFVPVNNKTMMNILQQTLSLFMFLLEIKDKNADEKNTINRRG
ncbi:Odorant receptor 90 [Blattella germanica]|nr:Odorant receptor 90 [Blattella germanica]